MFGRRKVPHSVESTQQDGTLAASNALAAQIKQEAAACHPLVFAAKMVGFMSVPLNESDPAHITVDDIDHPTICDAPAGSPDDQGLSFRFSGQRGESGGLYLFPDYAAIWPVGEERPRPSIRAERLEQYVKNYRSELAIVVERIRTPFARQLQVESQAFSDKLTSLLRS